jgi:hypothetical protein
MCTMIWQPRGSLQSISASYLKTTQFHKTTQTQQEHYLSEMPDWLTIDPCARKEPFCSLGRHRSDGDSAVRITCLFAYKLPSAFVFFRKRNKQRFLFLDVLTSEIIGKPCVKVLCCAAEQIMTSNNFHNAEEARRRSPLVHLVPISLFRPNGERTRKLSKKRKRISANTILVFLFRNLSAVTQNESQIEERAVITSMLLKQSV